jgi:hypothetical protein
LYPIPLHADEVARLSNLLPQIKDHVDIQVEPNLSRYVAILADTDEKLARGEPTCPLPNEVVFEKRVYSPNTLQPFMPNLAEPFYEISLPYRPADLVESKVDFRTEVVFEPEQATPSSDTLILMCIEDQDDPTSARVWSKEGILSESDSPAQLVLELSHSGEEESEAMEGVFME